MEVSRWSLGIVGTEKSRGRDPTAFYYYPAVVELPTVGSRGQPYSRKIQGGVCASRPNDSAVLL
jgi:hypothetical protein